MRDLWARSTPVHAVALALLLLLATALPGSAAGPPPGELTVTAPGDPLRGEFVLDGSAVAFSAERRPAGLLKLAFDVNGLIFDIDYDTVGAILHFDGHGNAFSPKDRQALQALADTLDLAWDAYLLPMTDERYWIFRFALLLSEAPVGFPHEAWSREVPSQPSVLPAPQAPGPAGSPIEGACTDQDDQDGILVLWGACQPTVVSTWHDACPQHGFRRENFSGGCSLVASCLARCGGGCGFGGGRGLYSQDCADHDGCCAQHGGCFNPFSGKCGDEYGEAVDDFLFGGISCPSCVGPPPDPPPGPPPCAPIEETRTVTLPSRSTLAATPDGPWLEYPLSRLEERSEGAFLMDEWAVVTLQNGLPRVALASSPEFGQHLASRGGSVLSSRHDGERVLVVQTADHPANSRFIPTPAVSPLAIDIGLGHAKPGAERLWFRAEVAMGDGVDEFALLAGDGRLEPHVRRAVVENLTLEYADERRHRAVVFGIAELDPTGLFVVRESLVVLPKCCCTPEIWDDDCFPWPDGPENQSAGSAE